jgi:hypothetical protein
LDRHDGRITVNSEVGEGSEFTIWLRVGPDRGRLLAGGLILSEDSLDDGLMLLSQRCHKPLVGVELSFWIDDKDGSEPAWTRDD